MLGGSNTPCTAPHRFPGPMLAVPEHFLSGVISFNPFRPIVNAVLDVARASGEGMRNALDSKGTLKSAGCLGDCANILC